MRHLLAHKQDHDLRVAGLQHKATANRAVLAAARPLSVAQKTYDEAALLLQSLKKELAKVEESYGSTYSDMMSKNAQLTALQGKLNEKQFSFKQVTPQSDPGLYASLQGEMRNVQGELNRFMVDYNMAQTRYDKLSGDRSNLEMTIKRRAEELRTLEQDLIVAKRMDLVRMEQEKIERDLQILEAENQEIARNLVVAERKNKILKDRQRRTALDLETAKSGLWLLMAKLPKSPKSATHSTNT